MQTKTISRIFALLSVAFLLVATAHAKKSTVSTGDFHALVIDAGSKGTRLLVFRFDAQSLNRTDELTHATVVAVHATRPGLSFFGLTPEKVQPLLHGLVDKAKESLRHLQSYWSTFPIYLKGTAGLRDLIPLRRDAVMYNVEQVLSESGFWFKKRMSTVISGEQEAAFGWLALNLQRGSLSHHGRDSLGILDLGGASLQVGFVPLKGHYVLEHFVPMEIDKNNPVDLYAKSYLHYGLVEANRRVDALIISNALLTVESIREIDNPCFNAGMNYTPDFAGDRYVIPIHTVMLGSGSFADCQQLLEQLMSKRAPCWVRECTFDGVYQPRLDDRKFIGISTFSRIVEDLNLPANTTTPADIKQAGIKVCSTPYTELSSSYESVKLPNRDNLCFTAVYVYTVLTHGLGFHEDTKQITFYKSPKKYPEQIVDWALGAAVWEMNRLPPGGLAEFLAKIKSTSRQSASEQLNEGVVA